MGKSSYKLYAINIDEWTSEMESQHDYIKVCGDTVYFMSCRKENAKLIENPPKEVGGWLLACQFEQLATANNKENQKNLKKATEQFEHDVKEGLDKALEEIKSEKAVIKDGAEE